MAESKPVTVNCFEYQLHYSDKYGFGLLSRYTDKDGREDQVDVTEIPAPDFTQALAKILGIHVYDPDTFKSVCPPPQEYPT